MIANGTAVHWVSDTGMWDTSATGVITEYPAINPDGEPDTEQAWVRWDAEDDLELVSIDNLTEAR